MGDDSSVPEQLHPAVLLSVLESSLTLGVARVGRDGRILERSEGFARLLGDAEPNLVALLPADHREAVRSALAAVSDGMPEQALRLRATNGRSRRAVELRLLRPADPDAPVGVVVRDRSELDVIERRLALGERLRLVGEMTLGCAHELSNLLGVIAQITDGSGRAEDEERALLRRSADDALHLLHRLQCFARDEEPDTPAAPVDLREVLTEALELTRIRWQRDAAAGRPVDVDIQLLPAGTVLGSASRLRHAVANLITNALDAMPEGGRLQVVCRREGADAVVEISDTGIGIAPDLQERIFEPFFSTKGEGGLGLGLSLVSAAVADHGGRLRALSRPREGSCFEIRLPVTDTPAATTSEEPEAAKPTTAPCSILLVEDNHALRRMVARTLRSDGHEVAECGSAEDVDAMGIDPHRIDLMILDVSLPGRSGLELLQELRGRGHRMPVLLTTAWGLDVGSIDAVRILVKPFGTAALRRAIAGIRGASG